MDLGSLPFLTHLLQELDMALQSLPKVVNSLVLESVLLTDFNDERCDFGIVVLANAGENVVRYLIVQSSCEESNEEVTMRVINRVEHLRDGSFLVQFGVLLFIIIERFTLVRHVRNLKAER